MFQALTPSPSTVTTPSSVSAPVAIHNSLPPKKMSSPNVTQLANQTNSTNTNVKLKPHFVVQLMPACIKLNCDIFFLVDYLGHEIFAVWKTIGNLTNANGIDLFVLYL